MSVIEKLFVQIFERKKWIIDQAQQQCNLFDQHLLSKLLIDGIVPPPWLRNPRLHPFDSDPKELNKEDLISEVLFPQPHSTIPFSSDQYSLYSKLGFTTDDVQYQSGLHSSVHASKKHFEKGDGLLNLPDSSVNNGGCGSTGVPEMDSDAISPPNQMEARISDCYHDPALSLAKLQRSKSRQRALEQRNSSKEAKSCLRDDNNAFLCVGRITGSGNSSLQLDHIKGSGLVKAFDSSIQSFALEVQNGDGQMPKNGKSVYSSCITRSKSIAQKLNSSNVVNSSIAVEDSRQLNNVNEPLEEFNLCLTNHGGKEANEGEYQKKEMGSNAHHQRLTRSRSSSQTKRDNKLFLDTTLHGDKGVGVYDMQPVALAESTGLIKASDLINGSRRKIEKGGNCSNRKQGNNVHNRITLSSCESCGGNNLIADGSDSINKLMQSPEPLILEHSLPSALPAVEALGSQNELEFCAAETKENLRSSSSGGSISTYSGSQNHMEGITQSFCSNSGDASASCSRSAANKSQNVRGIDLASERSSSSQKDYRIATESAEENVVTETSCKNSKALTICTAEGLSKLANSSNIDVKDSRYKRTASNEFLLLRSSYTQTVAAEQESGPQEHTLSGVKVKDDDVKKTSAAAVAEVDVFDGVVEKHSACLGSIPDGINPDVGLDALPSDFVMSVKPRQLDFDDVEETSRKENSSNGLKECRQVIPPMTGSEPRTSLEVTSIACKEKCNTAQEMHFLERREIQIRKGNMKEMDVVSKTLDVMSSNKRSQKIPRQTPFLMNNPISSEVVCENSSGTGSLLKEAMKIDLISENNKFRNDEFSFKILADAFSEAITKNGLHGNTDETARDSTTFTSTALMDELNASSMHPVLSSDISLSQKRDGKDTGLSTEFHPVKNSKEDLASDVEHLCHQHKRRRTESEADKLPLASPSFLQKAFDSISQSSKLIWDRKDDSVENLLTSTLNDTGESLVSSLAEQGPSDFHKCLVDQMGFTNPSAFGSSSTSGCTIGENLDSLHDQEKCGQGSGVHLNCGERSNSRRHYSGGNAKFSDGSSVSLGTQCLDLIDIEDNMPEFEGFIMPPDGAQPCTDEGRIELEKLHIPSDTIEQAYILERIAKSNLIHSPFCSSSTPYRLHNLPDLYQSLPNGLLEGVSLRTSFPLNDESGKSQSDCLPYFKSRSTLDTKKPYSYSSPVQTLWDRITQNLGSSGKRESLKPELPCIDEENENADEIADTFQDGTGSQMTRSILRETLAEITDNANPPLPSSAYDRVVEDDIVVDRRGLDSVCTEFSFSGTQNKAKQKIEKQNDSRRCMGKGKENQSISFGANGAKRTTESVGDRSSKANLSKKHSMRKGGLTYSGGKSVRNNIVSNITSFIPLVQQKQPTAVTGKRDIKVRALEAAEAAKRIAEKKENERKMKKEAMKLEREKMEQQKLRRLELQKKMKEEERKKKDAEMAVRKRQREEERKEKERKRKRVDDVNRKQQEHEKICAKREENEIKCRVEGEGVQERTELMDEREKHEKLESRIEENTRRISGSEAEPLATRDLTNDETKAIRLKYSEAINGCGDNDKEIGYMTKGTEYDGLIAKSMFQEPSYDISPYKGSDDEDEDEDDIPNNKFIPSWASKTSLCRLVSSQQTLDPETIFPPQSFCNVAEVLLPRKLQLQQ